MSVEASGADLDAFMHHQTEDRYDVLRSRPDKLGAPISPDEFDKVVGVLGKYNRITVFDSGNDESSEVWRRMIDVSDQLVVATVAMSETAEAGRPLLEELAQRDEHGAALVRNAVVIVSQSKERHSINEAHDIAAGFQSIARAVPVIPFDPHMVEGHLRWQGLAAETRYAWIRAAAAVAEGF